MWGASNVFDQSSGSLPGSGFQSMFGQAGTTNSNAFATRSFGSPSPFGSQTGISVYAYNATGVPGQPAMPAFGSSPGATSESSIPAFGASSTSVFDSSSSSPGGSGLFRQQPAFGVNEPSPSQSSAFSSALQQKQPAFCSSSQFGAFNFGASTSQDSGSTFGLASTSIRGNNGTPFGVTSMPSFGSSSPFVFGSSSTPAVSMAITPKFRTPLVPDSYESGTHFGHGCYPCFGPLKSASGSTSFSRTPTSFRTQSFSFGVQTTPPSIGSQSFGVSAFGGQLGGTRIAAYAPIPVMDDEIRSTDKHNEKLVSISTMPAYRGKSHEELRMDDYQHGDKGGSIAYGKPTGGINFPFAAQPSPSNSMVVDGQPAGNTFPSIIFNPFSIENQDSRSSSLLSSQFTSSSTNPFCPTSSTTSLLSAPSYAAAGSSPFRFIGMKATAVNTGPTFEKAHSIGIVHPSAASVGQKTSPFEQPNRVIEQKPSAFTPVSSRGSGGLLSNSAPSPYPSSSVGGFEQTASHLQTPSQPSSLAQTSSTFPMNIGQLQPASSSAFISNCNIIQGNLVDLAASQSNMAMPPAPVAKPFGTLPEIPQIPTAWVGSAPSVQYGISSMPVAEKPTEVRTSSFLIRRYSSQRRVNLPPRKYIPNSSRVPFYVEDEETSSTVKADALFFPRENPRALIVYSTEQLLSGSRTKPIWKSTPTLVDGDENSTVDDPPSESMQKGNAIQDNEVQVDMHSPYIKISEHSADEDAIVHDHNTDIEALLPKLHYSDYYTKPTIQEIAAKEHVEPGFCCHVKDFVIGRHGYGSIKFYGETDVRRLDIESIVQFNNREVIVYQDKKKKPAIGQGLNKPAEITLMNIKIINRKTGKQYMEGLKVDKFKELLMKKAQEQGADFVSYDPVKGDWVIRVEHFNH